MKPVKATEQNIQKGAEIIRRGGLVAFPTETVYGLGADGLNPIAASKIFEVKKRPSFNPLILHIAEKEDLYNLCKVGNKKIELLIDKFWPGPLTLVLPKKEIVPEIITADNPTVAVRMPSNKTANKLIKLSGTPVAAPSANLFNRLSPTKAVHVYEQLGDNVDLILDDGSAEVGVESTIIEIDNGNGYLLRPGGTAREEIESVLGFKLKKKPDTFKPNSPGQLQFHYSPVVPLKFIDGDILETNRDKKVGALLFKTNSYDFPFTTVEYMSEKGDMHEAAANLFSLLHKLEKENIDLIVVEKIEKTGLGRAIMDRLNKATARYT